MSDLDALGFRALDDLTLADLDALWVLLSGTSVIDWRGLNFTDLESAREFLRAQEYRPELSSDRERLDSVRDQAVEYLREHFEYPIPVPLRQMSTEELICHASGVGPKHRQLCACVILKVMHIINHLQGRELLFMLPLSDAQVFQLVEARIYRVIGEALSSGLPIVMFRGGRKTRDSLYTKLLSKSETIAVQIYDKLRFRIVTRTEADVLPVLAWMARKLTPCSYVIPGESKNTLLNPLELCEASPKLRALLADPRRNGSGNPVTNLVDNRFSATGYKVAHFVMDLPVRLPDAMMHHARPKERELGPVVYVLTEFQVVHQAAEALNAAGDASHEQYKARQLKAVRERLNLGSGKRNPPRRTEASRRPTRPPTEAPSSPETPRVVEIPQAPSTPKISRLVEFPRPPKPGTKI